MRKGPVSGHYLLHESRRRKGRELEHPSCCRSHGAERVSTLQPRADHTLAAVHLHLRLVTSWMVPITPSLFFPRPQAPYNLEVPNYTFLDETKVIVG